MLLPDHTGALGAFRLQCHVLHPNIVSRPKANKAIISDYMPIDQTFSIRARISFQFVFTPKWISYNRRNNFPIIPMMVIQERSFLMKSTVFCTFDHMDLADIALGRLRSDIHGIYEMA